jgi:hypothetical protein
MTAVSEKPVRKEDFERVFQSTKLLAVSSFLSSAVVQSPH